ncbi:uncharacterized protein [Bombus flavifrons]|uniref:uncharacterized protein n=1 Tax=Bombus flavifrons TaxID=103934 RepID=UPI0037038C83
MNESDEIRREMRFLLRSLSAKRTRLNVHIFDSRKSVLLSISNLSSSIEYGKWSGCCNFMTFRSTNGFFKSVAIRWIHDSFMISPQNPQIPKCLFTNRGTLYNLGKNVPFEATSRFVPLVHAFTIERLVNVSNRRFHI